MALKKKILVFGLMLLNLSLKAQEDTIAQRIVLIGDAGQLTNGRHPIVDAVRNLITLDKKTTVLFLGDNLYKNGLPDDQSPEFNTKKAVLDSQLSVAQGTPAKVIMIPGNHDWENGSPGGFDAIIRQQLYVDFINKNGADFWPKDGCPGPKEISLGNDVTLILFDSQWWLHPYDKPEIESDCACKTKEELVTQIKDIAARNSKKLVILACHHPFRSNGMHGGYYTPIQHIFPFTDFKKNLYIPLPVLGSIYPIVRSVFGTPQDLKHPNYANMIDQVSAAVKSAPNLIFVSGHDHNLQHIKEGNYNYIISGGGCKQNRTSENKNSLYNKTSTGFSVMEISKNKNVTIAFYTVTDSAVANKDYTASLLNFSKIPESALDTANALIVDDPFLKYKDTVTIAARKNFPPVNGLKKIFMGQNYRAEWSAPVNMKVFNLKKEKGGFDIIGMGGDKQTKSLRLKDKKTGKEWVLRSVSKSTTKAIPEAFRGALAEDMAAEINSAAHPYAALTFPVLGKAIDVNTPKPELFFVPDDPALSFYRPFFANNVCMLEEVDPTIDGTNTKTTSKIFGKMMEENDHLPDQQVVLRARLLDIITGDFDRHLDQWRWGISDTGKGKIYYPIPRDRDQAFFYSDGLVLKLLSGKALPFLKGFRNDIPKVNWLGYTARDFDRIFLTNLNLKDWKESAAFVEHHLTDSIFRSAVNKMPPEIVAIDGETIIHKLISRRNRLAEEAIKYYRFISKKVNIIGSNQREYFKVSNHSDGLQVRVYAISKGNDTGFIRYNRVFNVEETKEIRLYGLNDDDVFDIEENASSRIKIRIIGGKGYDTFDIRGHVENLLYDLNDSSSFVKNGSHTKKRFSNNPPSNERTLFGFNYNTTRFPQFIFGYNSDDGFMMGAGFSKRTYGFRNFPYATDQKLSVLYAVKNQAYQFRYRGEFNHITRNIDLLVKGNYSNPALRNFTGLGNNTTASSSSNFDYYRTRYKSLEMEALFRKRYFDKLHLMFGPYYFSYRNNFNDNTGTLLSKPSQVGLDSADIFSKKAYFGGKLGLLIDNRNNELFPTRGIQWNTEFVSLAGIKKGSDYFSRFTSDMTIYASLKDPAKLIGVLKVGGGHIFSKNYEYFQALNFGPDNHLNGFRKNRFAGTSSLYSSLELKVKVFNIDSYIIPGPIGLTGFFDAGKVWLKGVRSRTWHGAYGGGFYFMPFNLFLISASVGFSEHETMYNISLGTKINLSF